MVSQSDHHLAKIGKEGFDLVDELRRKKIKNGSSASTKSTAPPRQAHVHDKVVHTTTAEAVVMEPPVTYSRSGCSFMCLLLLLPGDRVPLLCRQALIIN
ncbi:hypothetical protein H6P81_003945 [Aristolochia fimbriata]|uniref:Uncharacterized protein n=1 Tax=Aristolochia fimbriata TaxID=158543 RepID=A0AAV7FHJ9_ARIFI|nr:hypothetical protein H6P81_003945 [Aristolochia fimbriata]